MMKFEIGKVYQHTTGLIIKICGLAQSTTYGKLVLIAEKVGINETFMAVDSDEDVTTNWKIVENEIWESQFSR